MSGPRGKSRGGGGGGGSMAAMMSAVGGEGRLAPSAGCDLGHDDDGGGKDGMLPIGVEEESSPGGGGGRDRDAKRMRLG